LQFYNDEHDVPEMKITKSRKPRRRKADTDEEYQRRLEEWEALLSHDVEVKTEGNSMTQKYYVERLLSVYLQSYNKARLNDLNSILQEDNDSSHETRSQHNLARHFKENN
jgi:hypothetical protein